jgi:hypothetical protein
MVMDLFPMNTYTFVWNPSSAIEDLLQSPLSSWPKCQNDLREGRGRVLYFVFFQKKYNFLNFA